MGWCERHRVRKTADWVRLCKTRPDYFAAWEQGKGPGQKRSEVGHEQIERRDPVLAGSGPGTELKRILAKFGIVHKGSCECAARAAIMDARGAEWCRRNLKMIIGWMEEEAKRRHLPFPRPLAVMLIKYAIRKSLRRRDPVK